MSKTEYLFLEKWKVALAIIFVLCLFSLDAIIPPFGIPIALIGIFILLKWRKISLKALGLFNPKDWKKTILTALIAVILIQFFGIYLKPLILKLFGVVNEAPDIYKSIEGNNQQLIIYLIVSWTTAGFGEEIIFRTFFMGQFNSFIHKLKYRWIISLIISSIIFGLAHYNKGLDAIITTSIVGFILGLTYLKTNKNIWAAYLTHSITNTVSFLIIYSGLYKELY